MTNCKECRYYSGEFVLLNNTRTNDSVPHIFNCSSILCPNIDFRSKPFYKKAMDEAKQKAKII